MSCRALQQWVSACRYQRGYYNAEYQRSFCAEVRHMENRFCVDRFPYRWFVLTVCSIWLCMFACRKRSQPD